MNTLLITISTLSLFFKAIMCSDPSIPNAYISRDRYGLQHIVKNLAIAAHCNSKTSNAFIYNPQTSPEDLIDIGITYLVKIQKNNTKTNKGKYSGKVKFKIRNASVFFALNKRKKN